MCNPMLTDGARELLRDAQESEGRLAVPLQCRSFRRHNRHVMELVVAGLLQPRGLEREDREHARIVYELAQRPAPG